MQALWGERRRIGLWRRLWLALMEGEKELGLEIPDAAVAELRAHLDDADLDKAADYERRLRHDVMAHIHHLGDQAPAARPFIHLGATSAYVTDNADLLLMREALLLLLGRIGAVLVASRARRHHRVDQEGAHVGPERGEVARQSEVGQRAHEVVCPQRERGRPSPRCATRLRWISLVPP